MFEKFRKNFPVSVEKWEEYTGYFHQIQVPARTVLLREGDISRKAYLVEKGCLRVWFNRKGEDITFQFFFENRTVSSIESFRNSVPSLFSIETVEPCTLWWIDKASIDKILEEVSAIPAIRSQILEALFGRTLDYMKHFLSLIRDTPQERYENLLTQNPHIVQRVPQHYIASYLGVSRVHLSRIKAKIARPN
ncbi:Crp/Fnr family transcriptional regulator [Spirosoma endophyticum]|uniref:cAMP-binding domain of CRP or a regulatory subunit of cAMP-dependent protein kinases n=1 Tax=Spirosoma endophyticum TaxID=662367 RepID=A0A1I1ZQI1_9BACT|nr:Crp/Fnr family transcriptional regulator [Spirosoma endophyticum]SFE32640.1 cAMP-binding domain of CRP or a regulatory subunit of cAMP-dependent protein kinases [Spirosoma endophyticum]